MRDQSRRLLAAARREPDAICRRWLLALLAKGEAANGNPSPSRRPLDTARGRKGAQR